MDEKQPEDEEEELLLPTWKKPSFGIQLEAPTRNMDVNIAAITKIHEKTTTNEDEANASILPFLPCTYSGADMVLSNPWVGSSSTPKVTGNSSVDTKTDAKIVIDAKKDSKLSTGDDAVESMGFIPYVEEAPAVAEPKAPHNSDTDDKTEESKEKIELSKSTQQSKEMPEEKFDEGRKVDSSSIGSKIGFSHFKD